MASSYSAAQIAAIRHKKISARGQAPRTAKKRSTPTAAAPIQLPEPAPQTMRARPRFKDRFGDRISVRLVETQYGHNVEVRYQGRPGDTVKDVHDAFERLYFKGARIAILHMCVRIGQCSSTSPAEGEWMANTPLSEFKRNIVRPRDEAHAERLKKDREDQAMLLAIAHDPGRCVQLRNGNW